MAAVDFFRKFQAVFVGMFLVGVGYWRAFDFVKEKTKAMVTEGNTGFVSWIICLGVAGTLVFGLLSAQLYWESRKRDKQKNKISDEKHLFMKNSLKFVTESYPESHRPKRLFKKVVYKTTVDHLGNATVQRLDEVKGVDKPLLFWTMDLGASSDVPGIERIKDLQLSVIDKNEKTSVTYLLIQNSPHRKKILIFPLPHIEPSEREPRRIQTEYKWEGMYKPLITENRDTEVITLRSDEDVDRFEFYLFFDPALAIKKPTLTSAPPDDYGIEAVDGQMGWLFWVNKAPAGNGFVYELELEKATGGSS